MEEVSVQQVDRLLKTWSQNILEQTKKIISSVLGKYPETINGGNSLTVLDEVKDRQSRVITTIQEAHSRQLEILKSAISEERREFARAQLIFEQSLRTKYDHSIEALRESIQSELEARMARTLKSLENQAKLEGERARQAHDFEYDVEHRLTNRLRDIISDLRKSWEEEEVTRIKQVEEKIRNNYNIVLEHMEAQLKMALQLQDDADSKWLEDLDHRNKKQLESIRMFEEKCRQLYETRLAEYAEKTSSQIAAYEEKLLEVGSVLAAEKNQFESRLRRIKLACSRWKIAYQAEIHNRYRDMSHTLEERYSTEISKLLTEIQDVKTVLMDTQRVVELREKEVLKTHEMYAVDNAQATVPTRQLRADLLAKCEELKLPPAERVEYLSQLLDAAQPTPELLTLYDALATKLTARVPLAQLSHRKQFLEYKMKLASNHHPGGNAGTGGMSVAEKAEIIAELTEVKAQLEKLSRNYERMFHEPYAVSIAPS
jgi:hypothetical protein